MKRFILLSYGFEKPTPEIMAAWGKWFGSIKKQTVDGGHLMSGKEITKKEMKDLKLEPNSLTGYTMINAESIEAAVKIAQACPIIDSIRVYEVMSGNA